MSAASFIIYSARIFLVPLWTTPMFVPIASPVYGQGQRWAESPARTAAILAHVAGGMGALGCALFQLDASLRRRRPRLHRWTGRAYCALGAVTVGSLRVLRATAGQGRGDRPDRSLQLFIDAASALWAVATAAMATHY